MRCKPRNMTDVTIGRQGIAIAIASRKDPIQLHSLRVDAEKRPLAPSRRLGRGQLALNHVIPKSGLTAIGPNSAASNYKRIGQSDWTPSLIALQAGHTPNQSLHLGIGRFSVSQCKRQSAPRNSDLCFPRASPEQPTERGSRIRQLAIRLSGSIF